MCGRIVIVFDAKLGKWVTKHDAGWAARDSAAKVRQSHYNVAPRWPVPVLMQGPDGPRMDVARWGFPFPGERRDVINTRIERSASPMWRGVLGKHNCVVPVTGFYEWSHADGSGQPHFIRRADGEVMALAGVAAVREADGRPRLCLSIVTCEPNAALAKLHDRMPAILEEDEVPAWLDPGGSVEDLARPFEGPLEVHAVSMRVNDPQADDAGLIEPVRPPRQARLM